MSDDNHDTQEHQDHHENIQENNEEQEVQEAQDLKNDANDVNDVNETPEETQEEQGEQGEDQEEQGEQSTDEAPTSSNDSADSKQEPAEDLFDLMGTAGAAFKKKPEKPETSNTQKAPAAKKPEEKRFAAGNTIVYSGHKIELEEEMTAEQLIAFLEDDFPELTKDTTEFTHDEARNRIVPTRKALKKGAHTAQAVEGGSSPEPRRSRSPRAASSIQVETQIPEGHNQPTPPVRRVLDEGGVYEIRNTTLGSFIVRIPPRINLQLVEGAYLKLPKAPVSLLAEIIEVFQAYPDREDLATIVYDHRNETHRLVWVPQQATATSIDYDPVPESEEVTVFCEIHSHNTMAAFYSSTDDGSEIRSTGLYGVIGHVNRIRPSAAFRFSCGTHFRDLSAADIFEKPAKIKNLIWEHGA